MMETEQRRAAKEQMIALMQADHRWQEAVAQAGIQLSRSTFSASDTRTKSGISRVAFLQRPPPQPRSRRAL